MNDTLKPSAQDPDRQRNDSSFDMTENVKASEVPNKAAKKISGSSIVIASHLINTVLIGLTVLLIAQWWSSTNQINQLREELARRLQGADISAAEAKTIAKSVQENDKELQAKLAVLESKQGESESHALALHQLYQDLAKNRDDWALSEIEQVLSTASQQLQLAGNVQGALIALQNADVRLARSDKPHFISIRRAIAHDIGRLRALPNVDLPGIALRLDSAINQVDSMPLLIDESPLTASPANGLKRGTHAVNDSSKLNAVKKASGHEGKSKISPENHLASVDVDATFTDWKRWFVNEWQSWTAEMWTEIRQLVRIRHVEHPDALLLAPSQGYFARENVKLRLLNARLALLSRNETAFKSDMAAAEKEIARYFDTGAKQTQALQVLLRQIQNSNVSIEMPSLTESLNAVRNFTVK
ncbi:MAG: uroporphyrin-III methyltransferase [Solimicrobium sp.]|jgi:uroporphyrin-3 C-methyltransferase/uroporphyrinogen III methyltransferase/synthase|nr:uroporphyrin-III methyltransferase [Solimicrobium sp.]